MNKIDIRPLTSIEDLEDVRRLESRIWGEQDSIPSHQTLTAVKNGGLVLGAYSDKKLVGFQYSFAGYNGKSIYLCSHILGTDPDFRNQGIGEKLKAAQRTEAIKLGYSLITWTYDPLESINGYLNINKLGGICSSYINNCYGEMDDLLNSGIPSDRFLVEWHITDIKAKFPAIPHEFETAQAQSLIQWEMAANKLPAVSKVLEAPVVQEGYVYIAVPSNYRSIRELNKEAALDWRINTRNVFTQLFENGWQVSRFLKHPDKTSPVHFYVLTKKEVKADEN
ncbi:putative GNAT superfamily acetyltransferase [Peribacillus deserti]|uniref:GNAT superfamily acetyltransferase n=1 Tax=Peribacillus deserti TaxID=673318 RepID=A0ABS2QI29_9BACI|nr:GNAT family N-acetyltransferase [Peribacillus deserti]MBM7692797.1 putative GNAT superfamily acetyltransferase [Peribacillus deserti]